MVGVERCECVRFVGPVPKGEPTSQADLSGARCSNLVVPGVGYTAGTAFTWRGGTLVLVGAKIAGVPLVARPRGRGLRSRGRDRCQQIARLVVPSL